MKSFDGKSLALAVAATLFVVVGASAAVEIDGKTFTPAPSQDSGLGTLLPYSEWKEPWVFAMPAEKIDSGLGELPPYAEWREPWVFAMPAEKIDSGLGEIAPGASAAEPAHVIGQARN
jgi:hypothetical protein